MHVPWQGGFCEGACPQSELVELWPQFVNLLRQLSLDETIWQEVITVQFPSIYHTSHTTVFMSTLEGHDWVSSHGWILTDKVKLLCFFICCLGNSSHYLPPRREAINIQPQRFIKIITYANKQPHYFSFKRYFIKSRSSHLDLCNLLFLVLTPRTVFCNLQSLGLKDSAKRRKTKAEVVKSILSWHSLHRIDINGFLSTWQPSLTFSSRAAILSFRCSCRRSLDSVRSLSTVSESRLLCSSFIFSLCRAWTDKGHNTVRSAISKLLFLLIWL